MYSMYIRAFEKDLWKALRSANVRQSTWEELLNTFFYKQNSFSSFAMDRRAFKGLLCAEDLSKVFPGPKSFYSCPMTI